MKDKILEEALKWYENQDENPDIEDFIDIVIHKTTDALIDKVIEELRDEFSNGNLKHNFAISSDYYLDLKFKDIKKKYIDTFYQNTEHSKMSEGDEENF